MKNIITHIDIQDLNAAAGAEPVQIVPASGTLSIETSADGQTREINLSARLHLTASIPLVLTADCRIAVSYIDEHDGQQGTISFGTVEIPARLQVADTTVRTVTCKYVERI